jgi:hypothetical protein
MSPEPSLTTPSVLPSGLRGLKQRTVPKPTSEPVSREEKPASEELHEQKEGRLDETVGSRLFIRPPGYQPPYSTTSIQRINPDEDPEAE